jgi:hypothetical protein
LNNIKDAKAIKDFIPDPQKEKAAAILRQFFL